MGLAEIFFIGVGLSMDAFAVAIAKGLSMRRVVWRQALVIALFFGAFQAIMPTLGWALGTQFARFVTPVDHWIAFGLLAYVGGKMLFDAFHGSDADADGAAAAEEMDGVAEAAAAGGDADAGDGAAAAAVGEDTDSDGGADDAPRDVPPAPPLDIGELFMLAIATSIDALATGITFAFLDVDILLAACLIGCTTFVISLFGVVVGNQFGSRWERPSTIAGGVVLIAIGVKVLVEHLFA